MGTTEFSTQLQLLRKKKGITQEQLAQKVGVSPQAVSKWENGSYPDGELLPAIAAELDVSIDALYGIGKADISIEQAVLNEIHTIVQKDEKGDFKAVLKKMLDLVWAMVIPCWKDNIWYWDRPTGDKMQLQTSSLIMSESGFVTIRHNNDLQYAAIIQKPECGFEKFLEFDDNMLELFRFMSEKANLKILYYLSSLNKREVFTEKSVCAALGISPESVKNAVSYLYRNGFLNEMEYDDGGVKKTVYSYLNNYNFLVFLTGAKTMLRRAEAYQVQVGSINQDFFDRSKLGFMKKDKTNEEK